MECFSSAVGNTVTWASVACSLRSEFADFSEKRRAEFFGGIFRTKFSHGLTCARTLSIIETQQKPASVIQETKLAQAARHVADANNAS